MDEQLFRDLTMTDQQAVYSPARRRDGVWTVDGLRADFQHLYAHPNCEAIHRVQTASGEHYAHESELAWDFSPND